MRDLATRPRPRATAQTAIRRVLNAGSGSRSARQVHPLFRGPRWEEVRVDVDPGALPDVVSSITDMAEAFRDQTFDAVWSSHVLEHLFAHDVPDALLEFRRILKPDGFVVISSPDLESVAGAIIEHGVGHVIYVSPAGPITPLDVLYGHRASIARGQTSMAHRTGFTCTSLGELLVDAGFGQVLATRRGFDLWALGLCEQADRDAVEREMQAAGLDMFAEP
jgi:predicted SAM-dependent methyltransferase